MASRFGSFQPPMSAICCLSTPAALSDCAKDLRGVSTQVLGVDFVGEGLGRGLLDGVVEVGVGCRAPLVARRGCRRCHEVVAGQRARVHDVAHEAVHEGETAHDRGHEGVSNLARVEVLVHSDGEAHVAVVVVVVASVVKLDVAGGTRDDRVVDDGVDQAEVADRSLPSWRKVASTM